MTKDEIKAFIELKQADMPFDVKDRSEALPLDGRDIITIPGIRRCGKSSRMEIAVNGLLARGVARQMNAVARHARARSMAWSTLRMR